MSSDSVQRLTYYLHDWEPQYIEARQHLSLTDLYILWVSLFRLWRRLTNDYKAFLRTGGTATKQIAYTGDTQRL
jgi:hypothetical protein